MSRISEKQRKEREATRRAAGVQRRTNRAASASAERACGWANWINALLAQFAAAIEAREELAAQYARDHAPEIQRARAEAERAEARRARASYHRGEGLAFKYDQRGRVVSRSVIDAPTHAAAQWARCPDWPGRYDRGPWSLVPLDSERGARGAYELRYYSAAGDCVCDEGARYTSRVFPPDLGQKFLLKQIASWLNAMEQNPKACRMLRANRAPADSGANRGGER